MSQSAGTYGSNTSPEDRCCHFNAVWDEQHVEFPLCDTRVCVCVFGGALCLSVQALKERAGDRVHFLVCCSNPAEENLAPTTSLSQDNLLL